MAELLSVSFGGDALPTLIAAPQLIREAVEEVVADTSRKLFRRIRFATPRDSGKAARGWDEVVTGHGEQAERRLVNRVEYINVLEFGGYPVVRISSKKKAKKKATKKRKTKRKAAGEIAKAKAKKKSTKKQKHQPSGAIVRGKARLGGGYPPGPRTQKDPGGDPPMLSNVSRQAPKGMVRDQLAKIRPEYLFTLEEAIDRALAGG